MKVYYFDSSAVVKNYFTEQGSVWVKEILNQANHSAIYTAAITRVEVVSVFARRGKAFHDAAGESFRSGLQFKIDFQANYRSVEIDSELLNLSVSIAEHHALRGYDCIQLAAALRLQGQMESIALGKLIFISADNELNFARRIRRPDRD